MIDTNASSMMDEKFLELLDANEFAESEEVEQVIETHLSWVIMTPEIAYKLKKPLKYDFLDYSSPAERKYNAFMEMQYNRRFSPGVYLGVVPVRIHEDKLVFGGKDSEAVEYAVKMKRMDEKRQMRFLLEEGKVGFGDVKRIADELAPIHIKAEVERPMFNLQKVKDRFNDILNVIDTLTEVAGEETANTIRIMCMQVEQFLENNQSLFEDRISDGMIRDVHGDLQSGNIFLLRRPVIFDCIEFNDEWRQIDLLQDIAYFCMDLDSWEKDELADAFLDKYLYLMTEVDGLWDVKLFHYYKCLCANFRVKVLAYRTTGEELPSQSRKTKKTIRKYVESMEEYAKFLM